MKQHNSKSRNTIAPSGDDRHRLDGVAEAPGSTDYLDRPLRELADVLTARRRRTVAPGERPEGQIE